MRFAVTCGHFFYDYKVTADHEIASLGSVVTCGHFFYDDNKARRIMKQNARLGSVVTCGLF